MSVKRKNEELEYLIKDIRQFIKKQNAIIDMISFYEILTSDQPVNNLIGITLIERVIKILKDRSLSVPYKGTTIFQFLIMLHEQYYYILSKVEESQEEYKSYIGKLNNIYNNKQRIIERDLNRIIMLNGKEKFNLIQLLLSKSPQLVYKFLVSDIPFDIRLEMFNDVLSTKKNKSYYEFFDSPNGEFLSQEEKRKIPKKMRKLLNKANDFKNKKNYIKKLSSNDLKNDHTTTKLYHESNWSLVELKNKNDMNEMYQLFVRYMLSVKENIHTFKNLYEKEEYLEVDEKTRTNSDLLILNSLELVYLPLFIKFPHFVVTEEKIELLKIRIVRELSSLDVMDLELHKLSYEKVLREIARALISKAKNKEEYKEFSLYIKSFIETVDIEKRIEPLVERRKAFSTLLYKMNDYAQENIPGKRLVKEIKSFK